ncbi:MAG: tetratricopeptide repeat protein [Proteobacteria bacterium]|nr:tetratricopeptide repeat protein [Pseudomonadota bacterium]
MKTTTACPLPRELSREISLGPSRNTRMHLAECESCSATWASAKHVIELGRQLPDGQPTTLRKENTRSAILSLAAKKSRPLARSKTPSFWIAAAAAAIALSTVAFFVMRSRLDVSNPAAQPAPEYHATLHKSGEATFSHTISSSNTQDEIVRLKAGKVTVNVSPLKQGERFRVITGDAEIEVRGTSFEVSVEGDSLVSVQVLSGRVEVRPKNGLHKLLGPDERWDRPEEKLPQPEILKEQAPLVADEDHMLEEAAEKEVASNRYKPTPREHRKRDKKQDPIPPEPDEEPQAREYAFEQGWAALRHGQSQIAAQHFERAMEVAGDGELAEDASFWRAVAYARAGMNTRATETLYYYLDRYPTSPRAGEASTMLGWKLFKAGNLDKAKELFEAAQNDQVARVRESANKGLKAIQAKRSLQ